MTTLTTTSPHPTFRNTLLLARQEAIDILRAVMGATSADDAPPRDARLAACAVLRLPIPDSDEPCDIVEPAPPRPLTPQPTAPPVPPRPTAPTPNAATRACTVPPPRDRLPTASVAGATPLKIDTESPADAVPPLHRAGRTARPRSPHTLLARAGAGPPHC